MNNRNVILKDYVSKVKYCNVNKLSDFIGTKNTLVVADENTKDLVNIEGFNFLELGAGEKFKTMDSVLEIVNSAISNKFDRNSTFISLGGGVLCDTTGFAASMYMRGCKAFFIPTTLLAMVDASVGGKTGIDFQNYKNIIGAFYPAETIIIDVNLLKTLADVEYKSGLGEVIKTAMLGAPELLDELIDLQDKFKARDNELLSRIVSRCINVKADHVEEDFYERGIRAHLNLGHTFGHALETVVGLGDITHGEAVVWGINKALIASGLENSDYYSKFVKISSIYEYDIDFKVPSKEQYLEALTHDKKVDGDNIRFILPNGPCDTYIKSLSKEEVLGII